METSSVCQKSLCCFSFDRRCSCGLSFATILYHRGSRKVGRQEHRSPALCHSCLSFSAEAPRELSKSPECGELRVRIQAQVLILNSVVGIPGELEAIRGSWGNQVKMGIAAKPTTPAAADSSSKSIPVGDDEDLRDSVHDIHLNTKQKSNDNERTEMVAVRADSAQSLKYLGTPQGQKGISGFGKPSSLRSLAKVIGRLSKHSARDLEPLGIVGKGSYAVVYKCFLLRPGGVTESVAVKRPRSKTVSCLDNMTFFLEEGVLMQLLNHRSIVKVLGFGCDKGVDTADQLTKAFLVEEFLPGGTILNLLESMNTQKLAPFSMEDAFRWMIASAEAISYLHSLNPMIVHRDIKPDNILLTHTTPSKSHAKITDFGLHRAISMGDGKPSSVLNYWKVKEAPDHKGGDIANPFGDMYQMTGGTGSVMYMAPEVMQKAPYNEKVDVFAFGVVLYEVFSGILLRNLYIPDKDRGSGYRRYATRVNSGWRPPLPVEWPEELSRIVSDCWAQNPSDRPSMREVVQRLTSLQAQLKSSSARWSSRIVNLAPEDRSNPYTACAQLFNTLCCLT